VQCSKLFGVPAAKQRNATLYQKTYGSIFDFVKNVEDKWFFYNLKCFKKERCSKIEDFYAPLQKSTIFVAFFQKNRRFFWFFEKAELVKGRSNGVFFEETQVQEEKRLCF
jgi:hypothetical protein